jgi:hypothetical protein
MVFVNAQQELVSNATWDPYERDPTTDDIDGYLPSLFGIQTYVSHNPAYYTVNNQIFDSSAFPPMAAQLQAADAAGYGALALASLTTVENELMGVPAGINVEVLFYYLSMPSVWYDQLPEDVQADIALGKKGPYPGFPHYSTAAPDTMSLNPSQSNLLSNMVAWTLVNNEATLATIFA